MRIGIDIDDTLTDTSELLSKYKQELYPDLENPEDLIDQVDYMRMIYQFDDRLHREAALKPYAKEALEWMHRNGHEIYIITARGGYSDSSEADTLEYFARWDLPHDKIFCNIFDKGQFAYDNGIDLFIDDKETMCLQMKSHGIDAIKLRKHTEPTSEFKVFDNWEQVISYLNVYSKTIKIGIDIDDTITDTYPVLNECLHTIVPEFDGDLKDYPVNKRKELIRAHVKDNYAKVTIKPYAKEAIDNLRALGIKVFIITARGDQYPEYKQNTIDYLKDNNINYDEIIFDAQNKKGVLSYQYNLDYLLDDMEKNLEDADRLGIKCLKFKSPSEETSEYKQFDNWLDIENYFREVINGRDIEE